MRACSTRVMRAKCRHVNADIRPAIVKLEAQERSARDGDIEEREIQAWRYQTPLELWICPMCGTGKVVFRDPPDRAVRCVWAGCWNEKVNEIRQKWDSEQQAFVADPWSEDEPL